MRKAVAAGLFALGVLGLTQARAAEESAAAASRGKELSKRDLDTCNRVAR